MLAWPASAEPIAIRLGYTTSPAVYLPAESANGMTISITSGSVGVFAGQPQDDSHRLLAMIDAGDSYRVSGLDAGEVLSVQSDSSFEYHVTPSDPGAPDAGTSDAGTPDAGTPDAGPDAAPPPDGDATASQTVEWTCTGTPCPWGDSATGISLVWPPAAGAITTRLGYTTSAAIYLPSSRANGATIWLASGTADAFAGHPNADPHRFLATITPGRPLQVEGLISGEVLSVQANEAFTYFVTLPPAPDPGPDPGGAVASTEARWRCAIPECSGDDWTGAVIEWPAWAAYQTNNRAGDQSRAVFSVDGRPLYPYMGAWAQGCEVTAESGIAVIIEWQRGTDTWRETWLEPRQSHVIDLVSPEDGAMIETYDGSPGFSVSLRNCTPQPIGP